jgi:N6-adenosine-specific RNA methylase IME4/predicted nucleic acid-binding Zn ribbon protein
MNDVTLAPHRDAAHCLVCGQRFLRLRTSRLTCSDRCRQQRSRKLRAATPELPVGRFDLIYADPPWHVRCWAETPAAGGRRLPYQYMDLPAICRLPVAQFAAADSVLAIWVDSADIDATRRVVEAWGFGETYEGLVWIKVSRSGKPKIGLGHSTRKNTESLWLAKRGKGLVRQDAGVAQGFVDTPAAEVIIAQRRDHSRKPDEAYRALERLYGDVRRLELFSRRARPGWERWGNQLLPADAEPMLPFAPDALPQELLI